MAQMRQSCVVVIADETPIGIVTERDVVRLFLGTEGNTTLGEVMTRPVASVQIDSAISDAAELMLERNFRHLAVVDRRDVDDRAHRLTLRGDDGHGGGGRRGRLGNCRRHEESPDRSDGEAEAREARG